MIDKSAVHLKIFQGKHVIADTIRPIKITIKSKLPIYFFPPENVHKEFLVENDFTESVESIGTAVYYDLVHEDMTIKNAAWTYTNPSEEFSEIEDYIAFNPAKFDACYMNGELVQTIQTENYSGWTTESGNTYN